MSIQSYIESRFDRLKRSHKLVRISVGMLLVLGGILGALPVLGFWMIPLGLILLAVDFKWARRALVNLKLTLRRFRQRYGRSNARRSASPARENHRS